MKKQLFCIIALLAFFAINARAQGAKRFFVDTSAVTTSWDSVDVAQSYRGKTTGTVHIWNDGNATIWIAAGNDTTAGKVFPLFTVTNLTIERWGDQYLRMKSDSTTIARRVLSY